MEGQNFDVNVFAKMFSKGSVSYSKKGLISAPE